MNKTSGVEVLAKAYNFLKDIDAPISIQEFINLEKTGNEDLDPHLKEISLLMLSHLKKEGMIKCDDLNAPNAKIHGLTKEGHKMHNLFFNLVKQVELNQ